LKTGNTSATTVSVTNFVVVVPATLTISKRFVDTFLEVPTRSVKSDPEARDTKFKAHARKEQPLVDFQLKVENKLNIIINDLMGIKHDLHVLKCPRFQA
jgi:hypothetical protein